MAAGRRSSTLAACRLDIMTAAAGEEGTRKVAEEEEEGMRKVAGEEGTMTAAEEEDLEGGTAAALAAMAAGKAGAGAAGVADGHALTESPPLTAGK